ncbi:ATP-binding cassette domain-containing protein [Epidermidibacterium keratini]|uniref:UvrABC system protein A n=2 Tax=Epidermidibacterium keratini TaxID=1891644 RepID=A0A7L4YTT1_9ACTN|nr:ATP-binding cassette domain-containing protein [Epidermidibacterium keratini]
MVLRDVHVNNLDHVDLDLPHGRLIVVVGVSGSGKSSLVFDTIAAEAGYQLSETFPPFARNRLPKWTRPAAGRLDGLTPVIVIDQRRLAGNARSTVGTITDAWTHLRLIYSRLSTPYVGESNYFSFNDPAGMCPRCQGLGEVVATAVERVLDLDKSLKEDAILLPGFGNGGYWHRQYADIGSFDADAPLREWTDTQREALLFGGPAAAALNVPPTKDYEGVIERFERIYLHTSDTISQRKQDAIAKFTRSQTCAECGGDRLSEAARTATVGGHQIGDLARLEIAELREVVASFDGERAAPAIAALLARLDAMVAVGLGYLSLARATTSLSGGEGQRVKLVNHLGSSLVAMTYVVDEPTVGLHPSDVEPIVTILERLRDRGNNVLIVEHDPAVMARADHIVEIGPGAGAGGGRVVFEGEYAALRGADTPTGRALVAARSVPATPRTPTGELTITGASRNNLRELTVSVPAGVLTALTGVAGSGKSSLAAELVAQHDAVVLDQRPVSANRRSTPITYAGIANRIRAIFAAGNDVPASLFSANSEGGCPACRGLGVIYLDLAFMDGQEIECPTCHGRRFTEEVLGYTVDGLSIADVNDLTVADAVERFADKTITGRLEQLSSVGLGYLRLGQSMHTLSGGEAQRVKIGRELAAADEPRLYVLDEPTTGLHPNDVEVLLGVLDRLVDQGHTVVVIEHNLDVIVRADWLIDLGPGAGRHGGRVLYEGPVRQYVGRETPTGEALARYLAGDDA